MTITRDGARTSHWAVDSPAELAKAAATSGLALSTDVDVSLMHEGQLMAFARTILFEVVTWRHEVRAMPRPAPSASKVHIAA
ncbi:hypothetical protein AAG607_00925 [Citromicrobium bathyomarinum]|uniref:hypothetical protein n=1 Tax=Citromicrobium bathyomarinum TaxID=72174 RepID=UPI00315A495C